MVSATDLVLLVLAAASAASAAPPQCGDVIWECTNNGKIFRYSENQAISDSHHAPLTDGHTRSSYPHWFTNGYLGNGARKHNEQIGFGVSECDRKPKHTDNGADENGKVERGKGPGDHYLLEFPTFALPGKDSKGSKGKKPARGRQYDFNSVPKDDPGPARVIYTYPHKHFCGIVSHTDGNKGNLVLCKEVKA